jgi:hypothetical protein
MSLKLNVLNTHEIERELRNIAVRTIRPETRRWFDTVARNYILNLNGSEADSEYQAYTTKRPKKGIHTDMPEPEKLPDWAKRAVEEKKTIHFFNAVQPRRRQLWIDLEIIADWFNTWAKDDPALGRIDRVNFPEARAQAKAWRDEVNKNPWHHIKDRPPVHKTYEDGMKWVQLTTEMHFAREGSLMHHCVGGNGYVHAMKQGTSEFYSLRDAKNEPHITVEVRVKNGQREAIQMKGKQNAKAIPKYQPYLRDLVTQPGWTVRGDNGYVDL